MLPGKKYTPEDFLRIAWRRKWLLVMPVLVIAPATFLVARSLPNRYQSEAVLVVDPQRVPESFVRSTVGTVNEREGRSLAQRLQTIQQQILTRTKLERVIGEFDLYPKERHRLPMEDVVALMRTAIDVRTVKGDTFSVAFVSQDAQTATKVAARLASLFIDENLQDRQTMATATNEFLKSQLDEARRQLSEQEQKVAAYQRAHAGELPSERQSNLQVLQNLQMQVQTIVESMNRDRDQRTLVQRQLADLALEEHTAAPAPPLVATVDPAAVASASAADQLEIARNGLRALQARGLKEDHPDVQAARRQVKTLEAKVQAEALEKPSPEVPAPARAVTPEDAARATRRRDLQTQLANLDIQLKSKQAEEQRLRGLIATYEGHVAATPLREAEMIALTRDYDTLQKNYESLLAKQEDSKVAANLEQRAIGEQFRIIDPARVPERPISPNRPYINLAGFAAGLGLGVGVAALLEFRDKSMRTEEDVLLCLSLPVLALVPTVKTRVERQRDRRRRLLLSCASVLVALMVVAGGVVWKLGWLAR